MAPAKKRQAGADANTTPKKSKANKEPEAEVESPTEGINACYFQKLMAALDAILTNFGDLAAVDALPMDGSGHLGLSGFLEPYSAENYDATYGPNMEYSCGFNFMKHNILRSPLPFVRIYIERVMELAAVLVPGLAKFSLVLHAAHSKGDAIASADLIRYSPDEHCHAVIFKVAERSQAPDCTDEEKEAWLRMLLSFPTTFKRLDTKDEKFAEANSGRFDFANLARAATLTARQTCYNINGFNQMKGGSLTASQIHDFFHKSVRMGAQAENYKKTTSDCAQTVFKRLLSISEAEAEVAADEATGPKACWNNLYNLQEVIYRATSKKQIVWLLQSVGDGIPAKKLANDQDLTCRNLKSGGRSLSDPILMQLQMRGLIAFGTWMSDTGLPVPIQETVRTIFKDDKSFRSMFNPIKGVVDSRWVLK